MNRIPRVLFVCVENSCRSQMAEAFGRRLGAGRVDVWSAGSRPSGRVHPKAIESMERAGYDLTAHRSKGLESLPEDGTFEVVVSMGCGDACPTVPAGRRIEWDVPDPKEMEPAAFDRVRDDIARRVQVLIAELAAGLEEKLSR